MNVHKSFGRLLIFSLIIVGVFGIALSSPSSAVGQGGGTPTREPAPQRTQPPGLRSTPTAEPVEATPVPSSGKPEATPVATPAALLPVSGGSANGDAQGLSLIIMMELGLAALWLILSRRVHAK